MVILGAGGHAKEILDVLELIGKYPDISFFDNTTKQEYWPESLGFKMIKSISALKEHLLQKPNYIIGVGSPDTRLFMHSMGNELCGILSSVISPNAQISSYNVTLGSGINIMQQVFISANTFIGKGALLNMRCSIHHDSIIEDFCEICPNASILGGAYIGKHTFIGAGAIILPKVTIGENTIIGAGSVVTHDIPANVTAYGVPAVIKHKK